jgi:hypothetical protein
MSEGSVRKEIWVQPGRVRESGGLDDFLAERRAKIGCFISAAGAAGG